MSALTRAGTGGGGQGWNSGFADAPSQDKDMTLHSLTTPIDTLTAQAVAIPGHAARVNGVAE